MKVATMPFGLGKTNINLNLASDAAFNKQKAQKGKQPANKTGNPSSSTAQPQAQTQPSVDINDPD